MDVALALRHRLSELRVEQRDLAVAAHVTESYISQLLNGKKAPPSPRRSDIYGKMEAFLKMPSGFLSKLADLQLIDELRSRMGDHPAPLFEDVRELILRKCAPDKQRAIRATLERETFGQLEHLVTQKLLDVVKGVVQKELNQEHWLREVGRLSNRSYEQVRVDILEFLETDIFHVSTHTCVLFLDPVIQSWDIDLETFGMDIILNPNVASDPVKRLEFIEAVTDRPLADEPGFLEFLGDHRLRGDATEEEIGFLKTLRFSLRHPTPLYYYRELQNLRDPLHFRA